MLELGIIQFRAKPRKRMEYPELKRTVWTHAAEWSAKNVLIEDRASGTQLIQELKQEGMSALTHCDSTTDKVMRMSSASNLRTVARCVLRGLCNWRFLSSY
jgi:phage terminase large subunit-like protein